MFLCKMKAREFFSKKKIEELGKNRSGEGESNPFDIWIVLDDVRSMNNVGSVFRTADSFNIAGIYLCGYTPCPPHRDIHKTALGATETVSWTYQKDITEVLKQLKDEGCMIYGAEQVHNSVSLEECKFVSHQKIVMIFGNEIIGISDKALALCDQCVEIPQWGEKHSLNISVAAGVVLWEMVRNRTCK
jgi:23S rRNA (guanosine2251-2'-O)-methyltransferase